MQRISSITPRSVVDGIAWPGIPDGDAGRIFALLQQLEHSQWWPADLMRRHQFRQLALLLDHADRTIPAYRERLAHAGYERGQAVTPELWARIPILDRSVVRESNDAFRSAEIPRAHGAGTTQATSGSTGKPLRVVKTALEQLFWVALTLREELWHRRDLRLAVGAIRRDPSGRSGFPDGSRYENWAYPLDLVFHAGPAFMLDNLTTVEQQLDWLVRTKPGYLVAFPSIVAEIARLCRAGRVRLPGLLGIKTVGGVVDAGLRELCRSTFGVDIVDVYSAVETGYLALQCPGRDHYHVQSECVLVEVLDDAGRLCAPGQIGQVVVTTLHNFATPMIRYAIGDNAELGEPCACGRGLPVIKRILGRSRDLVILPSGDQRYALLSFDELLNEITVVMQGQVIQRTTEDIEVKLVAERHLTADEENQIRARLIANFGYEFRIAFTYHDAIPRSSSGKFFDFLSDISTS